MHIQGQSDTWDKWLCHGHTFTKTVHVHPITSKLSPRLPQDTHVLPYASFTRRCDRVINEWTSQNQVCVIWYHPTVYQFTSQDEKVGGGGGGGMIQRQRWRSKDFFNGGGGGVGREVFENSCIWYNYFSSFFSTKIGKPKSYVCGKHNYFRIALKTPNPKGT